MKEFFEIIDDIQLYDVDDFFVRKAYIREKFEKLDHNTKQVYKWYFYYEFCMLKNPLKELLWEYIEGFDVSNELNIAYIEFCNKRDALNRRKID